MLKLSTRSIVTSLVVAASLLAGTREARADILVLANGGTFSVKDYRIDGDLITVTLRRGGQATFDRSIVARIAEDEVPVPEPTTLEETPVVQAGPMLADLSGRPFAEMIQTVAARHGVDPVIVHAVIQAESNYAPRARSSKGARGLMQVLPSTARQFGGGNLYDPLDNLDKGVRYLKGLLAEFDLKQAIAAYNAGPAAVRRYGGVPPFAETQNYVERVLANIPHE
jgi:hypothetical protein